MFLPQQVNNLQGLNAKNLYNGCNLLRVDFSKLSELSVRFNNDKSRDFTNPLLPSGDSQTASNTAVADQRSVAAATALAAVAQQGIDRSCDSASLFCDSLHLMRSYYSHLPVFCL